MSYGKSPGELWDIQRNNLLRQATEAYQAGAKAEREKEKQKTVNRFEVIDDTGRVYVKGSIYGTPVTVELSYQDDDRTLKVFVRKAINNKEGE